MVIVMTMARWRLLDNGIAESRRDGDGSRALTREESFFFGSDQGLVRCGTDPQMPRSRWRLQLMV